MSSLPINPFTPVSVDIPNGNFEQSTAIPPPGWQLSGATVSASYDTTNPYEGAQSLVVVLGSSSDYGVSLLENVPVEPNQIIKFSAAVWSVDGSQGDLQVGFYDANNVFISGAAVGFTNTEWEVVSLFAVVPPGAVSMALALVPLTVGDTFEFDNVTLGIVDSVNYYLSLITSEYQNAPNFNAFASAVFSYFVGLGACADSMRDAFYVDEAEGPQLDVLGTVVGIPRTLPFSPTVGTIVSVRQTIPTSGTGYHVGDILTVVQAGASGGTIKVTFVISGGIPYAYQIITPGSNYTANPFLSTTGGSGTGAKVSITASTFNPVMDDATYRIVIKAKILFNQWNGQIGSLYSAWQNLFPGGKIVVQDNQNMTANIFLIGQFTSIILDLINAGYIIPRPQGVQYNITTGPFPVFGFDSNNAYVAGFDTGFWA